MHNGIQQGIPFIVSAGNKETDTSNFTPAHVNGTITVGATNINDTIASFSNFGSKVTILAPGEDIVSAGINNDTAVQILSGTSMAAWVAFRLDISASLDTDGVLLTVLISLVSHLS